MQGKIKNEARKNCPSKRKAFNYVDLFWEEKIPPIISGSAVAPHFITVAAPLRRKILSSENFRRNNSNHLKFVKKCFGVCFIDTLRYRKYRLLELTWPISVNIRTLSLWSNRRRKRRRNKVCEQNYFPNIYNWLRRNRKDVMCDNCSFLRKECITVCIIIFNALLYALFNA